MFDRLAKHTSLIPLKADKTPAIKSWQSQASRSQEVIHQWGEQFPDEMFGSPTGALNGFWVLDIDKKAGKDGFKSFPRLKDLPDTLKQTTMNGGIHYFFKWDPARPVRNKTNLSGMKGVDVRGEGGYVVVCPSKGYVFDRKGVNFEKHILEAPDWLYELMERQDDAPSMLPMRKSSTPEELKSILSALDPTDPDFEDRDGWQTVLRACHSGSEGADWGKELFTEWSLKHPGPWEKDVEAEIHRDWDSYSTGKENQTTIGTLMHFIKEKGLLAKPDLSDTIELPNAQPQGLKVPLHTDKQGRMKATHHNIQQVFKSIDSFGGEINPFKNALVWDELAQRAGWFRLPPWKKECPVGEPIDDRDAIAVQGFLSYHASVEFGKEKIMDAMLDAAMCNKNHPIRNYLKGLEWDGQKRLGNWMNKWLGVQKDKYTCAVARKVLVGAIKRVMEPGCKFDTMLVLEGAQGCRKSSLIRALAKDSWYSAPHLSLNSLADGKTDAITNCLGSWIIEMEEMASVTMTDDKLLKKFLSTQVDEVTLKYDRLKSRLPRQFILIGSINLIGDGQYLRDITGNRRIWPIRVRKTKLHPIDIEGFEQEVDQLWAEAFKLYEEGYPIHLSREEELMAEREQEGRVVRHHGIDLVEDWIRNNTKSVDRVHTCDVVHSIWGSRSKQSHGRLVNQAFEGIGGWEYKKAIRNEGKVRGGWEKIIETDEID